jgi:hypothetical protein
VRSAGAQIFAGLDELFDKAREDLEGQGEWPRGREARKVHTFHQDLFETEFDRGLVPVFLDVLGYDAEKREFKRWCKILYADFKSDTPSGLFKNTALIRVCFLDSFGSFLTHAFAQLALVMIYGPKAVNGSSAACKFRKGNPLAGTDPTTSAGLIALCAILVSCLWHGKFCVNTDIPPKARFLLTADQEFPNSCVGAQTKIDWPQEFMKYKRYIMTSWDDQTTRDLVVFWNTNVFPTSLASVDSEFQLDDTGSGLRGRVENEDEDDIAVMRQAAEQERLAREQQTHRSHISGLSSFPSVVDDG